MTAQSWRVGNKLCERVKSNLKICSNTTFCVFQVIPHPMPWLHSSDSEDICRHEDHWQTPLWCWNLMQWIQFVRFHPIFELQQSNCAQNKANKLAFSILTPNCIHCNDFLQSRDLLSWRCLLQMFLFAQNYFSGYLNYNSLLMPLQY